MGTARSTEPRDCLCAPRCTSYVRLPGQASQRRRKALALQTAPQANYSAERHLGGLTLGAGQHTKAPMGENFALGVGTLPIGGCTALLRRWSCLSTKERPRVQKIRNRCTRWEQYFLYILLAYLLSSVWELCLRAGSTEGLFSSSLPDSGVAHFRHLTAR